jgi:aryl-alcohol dehydrogenase
MRITAAVVPARGAPFGVQALDLATPQDDEVLVRIIASGMCHTDLHARDGYFPNLPYPIVCGHEGAGIVEAVGGTVGDLAPGDPVVISFPWCGECEPCQAGRTSYCVHGRALKSGGRRADGSFPMSRDGAPVYSCFFQQSSFATFAVTPAKDAVKIRRDAPLELLGPLGCGLQTGAGTHFALETSAVPAVFRLAVDGLRGLGTCVLVGSARAGTEVSFEMPWLQGGRTVRGVVQGDSWPREFIPRLVDLFMEGKMPLDRLITAYDFAEINRAAADASSGATIKPILRLPAP